MTASGLLCGSCGTELSEKAKFCSECGAAVTLAAKPAEYKQVKVLFADVVRSMQIGATVGAEKMSNVLDLLDQSAFDAQRLGATAHRLLQCVWVYNRPIDIDGLRQFHEHLQRGRLLRCIERSPLPFGRHRWVSPDYLPDIEVAASARPRDEFEVWLDERANTPLDVEHGPGWHLAVLPFTDGGAGVSLVTSHCLSDGVGLCEALADAALGRDNPISWPAAGSRRRWQALREDARQTARDAPAIGRAVVAAARLAWHNSARAGSATPPPPLPAGADEPITLSSATVFIDADEWDARAQSLGGTGNTLLAGLAARLAQRVGRVTADGLVTLTMPVNNRAAGDSRANAVLTAEMTVDPEPAPTDLREIRAAIKQALIRHAEGWVLLPITPLLPERLMRTSRAPHVLSSNFGAVNPAANRPDGTDADYFAMKGLALGATKALMHRRGGTLTLMSGRVHGQIFLSVIGYQPGRPNSNDALRQDLSTALNDFSLTGTRF